MTILIAIFLTYGRMSSDSETVVLKASGMSFWGISRAAVVMATLCCIVLLFVSLYLLPRSMQSFKRTLHETIVKKASMTFEAGAFSDVFKGTVIYVKEIPSEKEFKGIFIYKETVESIDEPVVIVAEKGVISSSPEEGLIKLTMSNGLVHTYGEKSSSEMSFSEYDFILTSGVETMIRPPRPCTIQQDGKDRPSRRIFLKPRNSHTVLYDSCYGGRHGRVRGAVTILGRMDPEFIIRQYHLLFCIYCL
jgi:lipopolysaccharide export LptBFGC system permease protein LptF